MKACKVCGVVKPMSEYYLSPASKDGHLGKCKDCCRKYALEKARSKRKYAREEEVASDGLAVVSRICRESRAVALNVKSLIDEAVANNLTTKASHCDICGSEVGVHGHTSGDGEVEWLCLECHENWHQQFT